MRTHQPPAWWQLYWIAGGVGAILFLQTKIALSGETRHIVLLGTILVAYLLVAYWVWENCLPVEQDEPRSWIGKRTLLGDYVASSDAEIQKDYTLDARGKDEDKPLVPDDSALAALDRREWLSNK